VRALGQIGVGKPEGIYTGYVRVVFIGMEYMRRSSKHCVALPALRCVASIFHCCYFLPGSKATSSYTSTYPRHIYTLFLRREIDRICHCSVCSKLSVLVLSCTLDVRDVHDVAVLGVGGWGIWRRGACICRTSCGGDGGRARMGVQSEGGGGYGHGRMAAEKSGRCYSTDGREPAYLLLILLPHGEEDSLLFMFC